MSDKAIHKALADLVFEWDTHPVRRSQVRTLSPRLAELLDALTTAALLRDPALDEHDRK